MASLARPMKRQRQDYFGGKVSTRSIVPKVPVCLDSTRLLPLVDRLSEIHVNCSDDMIEIIGQIRSDTSFLELIGLKKDATSILVDNDDHFSIRKLHGTLILHIGFLLGSQKKSSTLNKKWEDIMIALMLCLQDVYTSNKGMLPRIIIEEELNELFVLVPKIIRIVSTESYCNEYNSKKTTRQKIVICCFEVIKSWLNIPVLLEKVLSKSTSIALEDFLFGLLRSKDANAIAVGGEQEKSLQVFEQLRSLCEVDSEFRKLLDVTILAIKSYPPSAREHLSPRLTVFYWRCVSCATSRGHTSKSNDTILEVANHAIDAMMPYCICNDHMLSTHALSCIGEYIQISSDDRHAQLIQFASKVLLERNQCMEINMNEDNGEDANLIQILQCLGFCMKRASAIDCFLRMKGWEKVFDELVCFTEDENDLKVAEKATIVLIPTLKALIMSTELHSPILFRKAMSVLMSLLSLHHGWIVGSVVELLCTVLQNSEARRRIESSTLLPELVNMVGELSSKNVFAEESKKAELAQTFSSLIDEIKNVNFLARKASNLTFLVRLANGSYCKIDQSRVQEISVYTVMKLARNPCNQRILAKEPGLLSTLIRYTRITPENTEVLNERRVSRKEMKDCILLIANAL